MLKRRAFDEAFQYDDSLASIDSCPYKVPPSEIVREAVQEMVQRGDYSMLNAASVLSMTVRERNFLVFHVAAAEFRVKQDLSIEKN